MQFQPTTTEDRWELPESLQIALNPELLVKAEAKQKEWAQSAASPYGSLSPQEFTRARAAAQVPELAEALAEIRRTIHKLSISDPDGMLEAYENARVKVAGELAEAYAEIGRFDSAELTTPDPVMRRWYEDVMEAVLRDDEDDCGHDPSRKFVERDVWSIKHDRMMHLIKCAQALPDKSLCGFRNVQALPPYLAKQRAARARAMDLAKGLSPEDAKQVLIAREHTTEKLLK